MRMRSSWLGVLGLSCIGLSLTAWGAGCGKGGDKLPATPPPAPVPAPPEIIKLSFEDDPGFLVPLEAARRFGSFNRMLPGELRDAATWASIELTMADGTSQIVVAPRARFGQAGYDLRAASPGMKLVVFDEQSQAIKASFGPLAKLHVTPTAAVAAASRPRPFPIVIDGKGLVIDADQLASQPTVTEPSKHQAAWALSAIVEKLSPACDLQALVITTAEASLTVQPDQAGHGYLRFNKKGVWLFSMGAPARAQDPTLLRDVTRIEATCKARALPPNDGLR